jgi:hypothetical protein
MASKAARKSAPSTGPPRRRVLASKAARKSAPSRSSYTRQDEARNDGTPSSSDGESPASLKRSRSPVEDRPNKVAKLSGPEYVKDLEGQIEDLHTFIIRKNMILGRLLVACSSCS